VRALLGYRRTYAAALVGFVAVCVVIGALRDSGSSEEARPPEIRVSPSGGPSDDATPDDEEGTVPAFPTAVAPSHAATDSVSGLPLVPIAELPPEAAETVELIHAGGPFPDTDDGETFLNSAGLLPERETGYYRVYTVPTDGSAEPTSRRIVTGTDGELYWTDDLYRTFRRIEE